MTKKYSTLYLIFTVLSLLLTIGPFCWFCIEALIEGTLVTEKVSLLASVLIVGVLTLIGIANKCAYRSRLWILMIGVYICLKDIMSPLLAIAICTILDELICTPLKETFKQKRMIHKELDKRG